MVPIPLLQFQDKSSSNQNGSECFKYTNYSQDYVTNQSTQSPPVRKAPRKPAPPVPPVVTNLNSQQQPTVPGHESLKTNNNNNYSDEIDGKKCSPVPVVQVRGGHKSERPSFRSSAFPIGSSSETIDSCGSRSPIQNGDMIGSLDRRSVIRRNSSERRPTDRKSMAGYRTSKLIEKPNIPPPSVPRRPNVPPPERPERSSDELRRQKSAENLFDEYSSSSHSTTIPAMSKSFSVGSSKRSQDEARSQDETRYQDETKERRSEEKEEEGGGEIIQAENNVIRLEPNTGIQTSECEKYDETRCETLVTRSHNNMNSSEEEEQQYQVSTATGYEATKCSALPPSPDVTSCHGDDPCHDVKLKSVSSLDSPSLSPTDERPSNTPDRRLSVELSSLPSSSSQEVVHDQVKVKKPPKPLPPPIKPRNINSLNEASRL